MDSTLVTQSDGSTQAKRQRVQIGGSSGTSLLDVVSADPGKNANSVPALAEAVVSDLPSTNYVDNELRPLSLTADGRLRVSSAPAQLDPRYFDLEHTDFGSVALCFADLDPWS